MICYLRRNSFVIQSIRPFIPAKKKREREACECIHPRGCVASAELMSSGMWSELVHFSETVPGCSWWLLGLLHTPRGRLTARHVMSENNLTSPATVQLRRPDCKQLPWVLNVTCRHCPGVTLDVARTLKTHLPSCGYDMFQENGSNLSLK